MKLIDDIMAARAKHYERDSAQRREFNERRTTPRNPIASVKISTTARPRPAKT